MANHLDLEEQEQLDQLKHFWRTWGTLISTLLIVVFGALAAWNGYQFWQNRQASQAAALFDAVEVAVQADDAARLEQAFADIRDKYAGTMQAGQTGLLVAKKEFEKGNIDAAQEALEWVAGNAADDAYKSIARLRLSALLIEKKSYDEALKQLMVVFPVEFEAAVADRRGDVLVLQGKAQEAVAEYSRAYKLFDRTSDYRRLIEVKLNALGMQPQVIASSTPAESGK